MNEILPQLALIGVLVILNAAFAGTEMALVSLREGQLQRLEAASSTGATLARLARQPNQFLATIQIGITLAGFLASAAAAVSLAAPFEEPLSFLGGAAGPTAVVVTTLILAYLTLVFGELAPKRLALQRAEAWAMAMARPLAALTTATRPAVWLLSHSTDLAVRLLGGDPSRHRAEVTEEELRDMISGHDEFTAEQRLIIDGTFEVADRTLAEVLVPRRSVFVLDADHTCADALAELAKSGHTRAPVAPSRNLDMTMGVTHLRQLLTGADEPITTAMAEVPVFPEAAHVLPTMRDLQVARAPMALVVNEHGGVEGIVTIEDLLEELVGEIYDETDPDPTTVRTEGDGTLIVPGAYPVHDLADIGVEMPSGNYTTIAGLVLDQLGRIPREGDEVVLDQWIITVTSVHRHVIAEVAVTPIPSDADAPEPLVP
ncbi:MAG: hemolysin family protein [Acidimicrobiales bacterium]